MSLLPKLNEWLMRKRAVLWAVSYWPIIAGIVIGLPFAFMPAIFDLTAWAYLVTVPIGFAAGMVGYGAAYLWLSE